MAVNDVLAQLQQLLRKATPLVEGAERLPESFLKLTPGQQVTATVLSQLPNGRFLVLVNDQHLDVNLPPDTRPGSQVSLRYAGAHPRPTFLLEGGSTAASRQAVNLSDTARFIGALLARVGQMADAPTPLARSAPVLANPPAQPQELALALKTALTESGLFYEAHQAQWVAGQRSLGELLREPQGRLSEPRAYAAAQVENRPPAPAGVTQGVPEEAPPASRAPETARPEGERAMPQPPAEAHEPVHPQAAPLVRQQLEVLDSRQLVWQGEVWPGQVLRWEIEEREAGNGHPEQRQWATRLTLNLPVLGEVDARLRLTPQGVLIHVCAAGESVTRLTAQVAMLQKGFERAGLVLAGVRVTGHD